MQILKTTQRPKNVRIPTKEEVAGERERLKHKKEYNRVLRSTIYALLVVAAIAVLQVSGSSMEPTLADEDIIILAKTNSFQTGELCGFYWQNKLLLKRIIGTPGDIIDIKEDGTVFVNGEEIEEPYVSEKALGECDLTFPYQVPENRYFVMGDHRTVSIDSRSSVIGCVEKEQIIGKVIMRIWPLSELSIIH